MTDKKPLAKGYNCPNCDMYHIFGMWVFAHWDETIGGRGGSVRRRKRGAAYRARREQRQADTVRVSDIVTVTEGPLTSAGYALDLHASLIASIPAICRIRTICEPCKGDGTTDNLTQCPACGGYGYTDESDASLRARMLSLKL